MALPKIFELELGESCEVLVEHGGTCTSRSVKLTSVTHLMQPDYWCQENVSREIFERALVEIEVDGVAATLLARPYQMPQIVNGLRLAVETTRSWAENASYARLEDVKGEVRFAAVAAGAAWGPAELCFPIGEYRWRAASYNNTWTQIVPYNQLYYHRGEDYGAIPDLLPVVAPFDGVVTKSPLPAGDGASNGLVIEGAAGLEVRFGHMNIEEMLPAAVVGKQVVAGMPLGRTGSTWSGRRSQTHDPHLHVGFRLNGMSINPFPFMMEAYFRSYPDSLIANAGGYAFALPGGSVRLDGSRSLARPGRRIVSYHWELHDGQTVEGCEAGVSYEAPGLYSEKLTVVADDGSSDCDFLQVRVFDRTRGREIATGWLYTYPGRGAQAGKPLLFWNRLRKVEELSFDAGDGAPLRPFTAELEHVYREPGSYTVTAHGRGPGSEPVTVRLRVVVE